MAYHLFHIFLVTLALLVVGNFGGGFSSLFKQNPADEKVQNARSALLECAKETSIPNGGTCHWGLGAEKEIAEIFYSQYGMEPVEFADEEARLKLAKKMTAADYEQYATMQCYPGAVCDGFKQCQCSIPKCEGHTKKKTADCGTEAETLRELNSLDSRDDSTAPAASAVVLCAHLLLIAYCV